MIETVRAEVMSLINSKAVTLTTLSTQLGVSRSQISLFMSDKYTGDNAGLAVSIQQWLANRATKSREIISAPRFFETATSKTIHKALQYAQLSESITVIYGVPGVGKTKALQAYTQDNPNVWMITASPSCSSLSEALYEIALELDLNDAPRRAGGLSRAIKKKMIGTGGLLIIDEADHLDYAVLEELRSIQEATDIGLALVGNHRIYSKMTGGNSRTVDFARLFSRIAKKVNLLKCRKGDVSAVAEAWNLGAEETALIEQLAERPGALRSINQVLRLAAMFAAGKNEPLNVEHIRNATKDLEGDK